MKKYRENTNKKYAQKFFYKVGPVEGISLIVLVITIIVIIILASAVIVSLVNNNPITSASEARIKSDVSNMQGVFTNAVSKVMAESQDVIEITAGPLNTVTSGEKSAVGNAVYKLSDGTNGEVIFDTLPNEGLKYYTGKRLPIYNKKTTWYVDEDGIISLEVGDKKYGEGQIVKSIKIVASVIPSEEYIKKTATVKVEISSEEDIASIKFGGKEVEVPERKEGKYEVEIEVTENGTYEIEVSGVNGATNKAVVEVNEIDNLNEQIGIKETVTITEDYVKGNIGLEITYSKEIESIKINGESITVPNKVNGKYIVNKEVLENREYKVEVKAKDGTTNKVVVKVTQITEDMDIWNRADMESFRDKVNSGRTFVGKTVKVMADIDLQGSSSNQWIPIGKTTVTEDYGINGKYVFKGTFEGDYHKIQNLYIDNDKDFQGLFQVNAGDINRIQIVSGSMKRSSSSGVIAGLNKKNISECCNLINYTTDEDYRWRGGIVGLNAGTISYCYNKGKISGYIGVGGIVGDNMDDGVVDYCYNAGEISGGGHIGGIVGANYGVDSNRTRGIIRNSYNRGIIIADSDMGSIVGQNGANSTFLGGVVENCYYLSGTCSSGVGYEYDSIKNIVYSKNTTQLKEFTLNNIFIKDTANKNEGYPILKWQLNQ